MAAELRPILTIELMPEHIIERFAPDMRPRTISTLRLVSQRFRDVFTADRYYRPYLCYADRPGMYRGDLEESGEARDRWRRCLEAEKRRLDNWRRGRFRRVDSLALPEHVGRDFVDYKHDCAADEDNEHWLLFHNAAPEIVLANVTKEPVVSRHSVGEYVEGEFEAFLAPGQVFVRPLTRSRSVLHVFDYGKSPGGVSLRHRCLIEYDFDAEHVVLSGRSDVTRSGRNLVVSHTFGSRGFESASVLYVWDSTAGSELDPITFEDFLPLRPRCRCGPPPRRPQRPDRVDVAKAENVVKGPFPNVLVCTRHSAIVMVDVERRQLTRLFEGTEAHRIDRCAVYANAFCLLSHSLDSDWTLGLYSLDQGAPADGFFLEVEPLYRLAVARFDRPDAGVNFCLGDRTLVAEDVMRKYHIVDVDGLTTTERVVRMPQRLNKFTPCVRQIPMVSVGPFIVFGFLQVDAAVPQNLMSSLTRSLKSCDSNANELFRWDAGCSLFENTSISFKARGVQFDNLFRCVVIREDASVNVFHF